MSYLFREALLNLDYRQRHALSESSREQSIKEDFFIKSQSVLYAINEVVLDMRGKINISFENTISLEWESLQEDEVKEPNKISLRFTHFTKRYGGPSYELLFGKNTIYTASINNLSWKQDLEHITLSALSNNLPTAS